MTTVRVLLGITGALSFLYAWPALFLIGERDFGVAVAVSAGCVLLYELSAAVQEDRQTDRERMRRGRDAEWQRRARESEQLFGADTTVFKREAEMGNVVLRRAAE